MIEVTVASLLVGVIVVGSIVMLEASVRSQTAAADLLAGPSLADSLLAEVQSMAYEDPEQAGSAIGPDMIDLEIHRHLFDDVDDYDGWMATPPRARDGTPFTEYAAWRREVEVNWASPASGDEWAAGETGLKRIVVTVTAPDGTTTTRFGLRSRNGALEQAPEEDRDVVTMVETSLAIGASSNTVRQTTNLLNHVEEPD